MDREWQQPDKMDREWQQPEMDPDLMHLLACIGRANSLIKAGSALDSESQGSKYVCAKTSNK